MLTFKSIDLFSQLAFILAAVTGPLLDQRGAVLSISLLAVAIIQIISLIIHASIGKTAWKSPLRKWHLAATALVILVMVYGLFKPGEDKYDFSGLAILIKALIPAAFVAAFYTVITWLEWKKIRQGTEP